MKTLFIEAKSKARIDVKKHIKKLPKEFALATTAQHIHKIDGVKAELEKAGIKVSLVKGKHSRYSGQILGCDKPRIKEKAVLFIGTGSFHPSVFGKKDVYVLNPESDELYKFDKKGQERREKKKKGALLRFYSSKNVGVLISLKPEQLNLKALELKKKFRDKSFYHLLFDTLNINELENFPFIECFVNTACPRIADDCVEFNKAMINVEDIKK